MRTETKNVPPPAGTLYNPRLLRTVTGTAVPCTCSCQETSREERFKATIGPTQGDEGGCVFQDCSRVVSLFFFLIEIIHNHVTDAFHDPKRPNGEDRSLGYCDEWPQFKAVAARITTPMLSSSRIGANDSCVYATSVVVRQLLGQTTNVTA